MKIQIRPQFVLSAMRGSEQAGFQVDGEATTLLASQAVIPIDNFRNISALKPYIKIDFTGGADSLIVAVRFQCRKDERVIHSFIVDRRFNEQLVLQPQDIPDLRPYQSRNRMLGDWKITIDISFFAKRLLSQISQSSYLALLSSLRYQEVVGFDFKIVRTQMDIELTPTGRMVEPRRETNTVYTIDDL